MKTLSLITSRRRLMTLAAVSIMAVTAAASAYAGRGHHHDAEDIAERIVDRIDDQLDLSRAQENELTAIFTKSVEQRQKLKAKRYETMQELWQQDDLSADDIQAELQEHLNRKEDKSTRREERLEHIAETLAAVHTVLTPEQRTTAATMVDKMQRLIDGKGGRGKHKRGEHCSSH